MFRLTMSPGKDISDGLTAPILALILSACDTPVKVERMKPPDGV